MKIEPVNTIVHFQHVTPVPIGTVAGSTVKGLLNIYMLVIRIYQCLFVQHAV